MFVQTQIRFSHRRLDAALAILLALLALAIRIHSVGFNSLSEDETAKWLAIQGYRQGHFAGLNSEHPIMPKALAWGSISIGERWNRIASSQGWPILPMEGWLRLPSVFFGAATAAILYFLCRLMMGIAGSFAAGFFWAASPLVVAINRLAKEETAFTFFTVLACYAYWRAKKAESDTGTRRWMDFSACAFGLAAASQYMIHLLGLNALAWHLAGRRGADHKRVGSLSFRFFLVMGVVFLLANPVVFSPINIGYVQHWLHHDGVTHTGYDFGGKLYPNFPSLVLTGVPWYFYFWMLLVKTPIPILVAIVAGSTLLLRERRTTGSCLFLALGAMQLLGLSLTGAKWMRYSLPVLPFLFLAGGYAVHVAWNWARETRPRVAVATVAAVVILGWPLLELHAWAPYYPLYLNPIGGGERNIARYFAPDEISEFDTREVAHEICPDAPSGTKLATARPGSMTYYLQKCGRPDIQIVPLYDPRYVPHKGDLIVLEPSRRFVETQEYFDVLSQSGMPRREVRVGPVSASAIYSFHPSLLASTAIRKAALTLPAAAHETAASAPLTADEVMARVVAMNEARARALATYSSVRTYHLECHCIAAKKADMVVRVNYSAPKKKEFSIVSESGSGTLRHKVFRKLLEAEQESMQEENERRWAITPENYTFRLLNYEKTSTGEIYLLQAEPRHKNKFLFRGRVWVNGDDFAIIRVEGAPAVNPSFWTRKTDFTRTYERVGGFWLPESNYSVTNVLIFGTAELTIQYGDYQVTRTPNTRAPSSDLRSPTGQ